VEPSPVFTVDLTKDSRKSPDHDIPNKLVTPRSVPPRRPSVPTFGQHSMFAQSALASGRGDTFLTCNLHTLYILTEHRLINLHKRATQCHALGAHCKASSSIDGATISSLEERERASLPRGAGFHFDRAGILTRDFIYPG
jgi:hypothetical protein